MDTLFTSGGLVVSFICSTNELSFSSPVFVSPALSFNSQLGFPFLS